MSRIHRAVTALNPVRGIVLGVGLVLARLGLVTRERVHRTTDLAWPRIVTGLARMSKNAADTAMVGLAIGPAAIAGVGFAGPFWGATFGLGGGFAAGTIALVAQGYGADAHDRIGQAIRSSVALVVVLTLPIVVIYYALAAELVSVLTNDPEVIGFGGAYLEVVAFGVPFAALNLVGSRALIGADDAWTPMVVRAGGAVANIGLSAIFIFGLGMGVVGAGLGTVLANVLVTAAFAGGLVFGRVPIAGAFPVTVTPFGRYLDRETLRDVVEIGLPVVGRNQVWTVARFPTLAFVGLFGQTVVAAYIISRRIWGLMNTPGWGFGLAASSLVGQELGGGDESSAETHGREIIRYAVATYLLFAIGVALLAEPIVVVFVGDVSDPTVPIAVALVYAACVSIPSRGVTSVVAGSLDASGDTRWPFYARIVGMFGLAIPLTYLGATTPLGLWGIGLAYIGQSYVPAAINYYRFSTGKWKAISRAYRPESALGDD